MIAAAVLGTSNECGVYASFLGGLRDHYQNCLADDANATCLPTRVSHPLVQQASALEEAATEFATAEAMSFMDFPCRHALIATLAVFGRALVHTARGQWAARTAFQLASRECWPTIGLDEEGWPVSYRDIIELALDAEAWIEYGDAAEYQRPPRLSMPAPLLHELTPGVPHPRAEFSDDALVARGSRAREPRKIHILSTGNHASYPSAIFSLWKTLLKQYDFELEDHSFDTRYCELAGSCSIDDRFAWLGEHLRGTVVETCGGLYLKGFEQIEELSEQLVKLLTAGGTESILSRADLLLCTHPPYSCRLFWPFVLRHGKPLLGFFGGTLEAHVPAEGMHTWLRDFREMARHHRVQFAAISPFLAEKMRYQTGVDIPAARGFGSHIVAKGITYFPRRFNEVLIWKNSNECEDNQEAFDQLLDQFVSKTKRADGTDVSLRFHHLRALRASGESSYADISSFRAVVFVPYEVLLMTFYELYHVGIPLFMPTIELGGFFMYRGPVTYPHCDMVLSSEEGPAERPQAPYSPFARENVTDRVAWLETYTDWFRFPHLQYFSSIAGLVRDLHTADMQAISAAMRLETEAALVDAADFWGRAFAKVLGES